MNSNPFTFPLVHPVAIVALVMIIITVAPRVARWARIPELVGIILAGAIVGPSAIGLLERTELMVVLGNAGLLYLLFMAGLSLDLEQFIKTKNRAFLFGMFAFCFPMGLAVALVPPVLGLSMASAVLVGCIVGTHTLVAYPLVQRLGLTKTPPVITAVGGTILADSLGLLILAVVIRGTEGHTPAVFWIVFLTMVVLTFFVVLFGVPALGRWYFRTIPNDPQREIPFILAVMFSIALLTELIGLAPIIGAFLTGLALNRLLSTSGPLMSRVMDLGDTLLVPFFLISVGLLVDFRVLVSSASVWMAFGIAAVALVAGKYLASQTARLLFRFEGDESYLLMGLTIPQAAATLAVTLVAYDAGLFDTRLLNAIVLLILVSCVGGPWIAERAGRILAARLEDQAIPSSSGPQRLLVPLANPATAPTLMEIAFAIKDPLSTEPVYPLAVARETRDVYTEVARSEALLVSAVRLADTVGIPSNPVTRVDVNIADGIVRAVRELRISCIVIGWNGHVSPQERIFGTILDRLLERTDQLMIVAKTDKPLPTTRRIVLAVPPRADHQPGAREALRVAKLLAAQLKKELLVLSRKDTLGRLKTMLNQIRPSVKTELQELVSWSRLQTTLNEKTNDDDVVLLISAREQTLAWYRGLDRLPAKLVADAPERSLLVLFPAEAAHEPSSAAVEPGAPSRVLLQPADHQVSVGLTGKTPEPIVDFMLLRGGGTDHLFGTPVTALRARLLEYQLEVADGIVLLHASDENLPRPMMLIGTHHEGLRFPDVESPVTIVLILLSPEDLPPQEHLENLSQLARLCRSHHVRDGIMSAESAQDIREAFGRQADIHDSGERPFPIK